MIRIFSLLFLATAATAQQYVISTYVGGSPLPSPVPALNAPIGWATSVVADTSGNVYFASPDFNSVFKLDPGGTLTRIAGNSRAEYSGDGGPATSAALNLGRRDVAAGLAVDHLGNLFIADALNDRIRRVSPTGVITTVAGGGVNGLGDGGPATSAKLYYPTGVAVDGDDNLFIADLGNNRIRKVSRSGIITTAAGGANRGFFGDGGLASNASLNQPRGVAIDSAGNLLIADSYNFSIRKVSTAGIITTVAGDGIRGFSGDGGRAAMARLDFPTRVSSDNRGNLFIVDGERVRKISSDGIIATVAGGVSCCNSGDGGPATAAEVFPVDVAADAGGNLFIASMTRIRKVSAGGIISTVAGRESPVGFFGDGGPATSARFLGSYTATDSGGDVFIADSGNNRIRKVSPNGIITTFAGTGSAGYSGDGGPATSAQLNLPLGVAVDAADNLFVVDSGNNRVRKITTNGIISTVPGSENVIGIMTGIAVDRAGNVFVTAGNQVGRIAPNGIFTWVAGGGTLLGSASDGRPATDANLYYLCGGLAVDNAGSLLIAACLDGRIHKVSPNGIITTFAGGAGSEHSSGDGGPATSSGVGVPYGVAVDAEGNVFISSSDREDFDTNENDRIRKVSPSGIITTIAGKGTPGFSGDGGLATRAQLASPTGLSVDRAGNVYFVETGNNVVRVLRPIPQVVWIGAVVDAASQRTDPAAPGKIMVIYGVGLGPSELIQNRPTNGRLGVELAGTTVSFNGIAAPVLYTSEAQVAVIVPYAITGISARLTVAYQGQTSAAFDVSVAPSAPSLFTLNQTGSGQAAAINGGPPVNTAESPVQIGRYISLFATGEGQTVPAGVDGLIGDFTTHPVLPVAVTVDGLPAMVQYAGGVQGVAGLMQVNVLIPDGVRPGGYVPVVLRVGDASTTAGAVWIGVSGN